MSALRCCVAGISLTVVALMADAVSAADIPLTYPVKAQPLPPLDDWSGFYVGGHIGYAAGRSNWNALPTQPGLPATTGSLNLYLPPDAFAEGGSFFEGLQAGYNHMLHNRVVVGVEADA